MLQKVRVRVKGMREQSLYNVARIELGLEEKPNAVEHSPWELIVQRPDRAPRLLPPGTRISAVFDELDKALLILGAPGTGKTTLLLELARDLLDRAERDAVHLIPVVFNLSSWAEKRAPLTDWLVDELSQQYNVPRKIGQAWVDTEQVLPLLDGLDEVALEHRAACVGAINTFHQQHGLVPLVVCSRVADYETLTVRLRLLGAVLVQPLTRGQVDHYLEQAGEPLAGVRAALCGDPTLWELLETLLMLSIVALTYQGRSAVEVSATGTLEERRAHLFAAYTDAMFKRRGKALPYTQQQTTRWLVWLAGAMVRHNQSVFYLEWMQPNWLSTRAQQKVVNLGAAITSGLVGGPAFGLEAGGFACLQHLTLRFLLWRNGFAPWHYVRFLDYAAERVFLRKVDGGYIFVHRLLLEYFEALDPQVEGHQIAKAG